MHSVASDDLSWLSCQRQSGSSKTTICVVQNKNCVGEKGRHLDVWVWGANK